MFSIDVAREYSRQTCFRDRVSPPRFSRRTSRTSPRDSKGMIPKPRASFVARWMRYAKSFVVGRACDRRMLIGSPPFIASFTSTDPRWTISLHVGSDRRCL